MRSSSVLLFVLAASSTFAQDIYDPDLFEVRLLQNARTVTAPIPRGFDGRPDWVKAIGLKQIEPRETLWGAPRPAEAWGEAPKEGIVFANTRYMPYVVFPHQPHVEWLACANCHDALFPRKKTGRLRGMMAIFAGETCGACHGRVAFAPEGSCYRCHSMPNPVALKEGSPFVEPQAAEPPEAGEDVGRSARARRKANQAAPPILLIPER